MTAAVFGIIGVIVGGVLNGVVACWLEERRDMRAVCAAARLLIDPLRSIDEELDVVVSTGRWWPLRAQQLPVIEALWTQHRELLASHRAPLESWEAVMQAFQSARAVYGWAQENVDPAARAEARPSTSMERQLLHHHREQIQAGRMVLEMLAGHPQNRSWLSRVLRRERTSK